MQQTEKAYRYLYKQARDPETIRKAFLRLRKGKTKRRDVQEIEENLDEEIMHMGLMLENTKPPGTSVEQPELAYHQSARRTTVRWEHGKQRLTHCAEIHDQWMMHILVEVLRPIIQARSYRLSCGCIPKRGPQYGAKAIHGWLKDRKGCKYFLKGDIRHFFQQVRKDIALREMRKIIKDEWFLYLVELALWEHSDKGLMLGLYLSPWIAELLLQGLDCFITVKIGMEKLIRYVDDIVIFGSNKRRLHNAGRLIRCFLGQLRLRLKESLRVALFDYRLKSGRRVGGDLDFMGMRFFREKTTIRKRIMLKTVRVARRLRKAWVNDRLYPRRVMRAMVGMMGWFKHTDSYDCYLRQIKPMVSLRKVKKILAKLDRREHRDRVENGALRGATAC